MAKGSSYERDISKLLSLWFTEGKSEVGFYRTAGSGGRATSRHRGNKEVNAEEFGDIKAETKECKPFTDTFVIELKTGYATKTKTKDGTKQVNWSLLDEIDSKQKETQFFKFWNQVTRDSQLSKKLPLLIFRRNNKQSCIAMHYDIYKYLRSIVFDKNHVDKLLVFHSNEYKSIIICNLNSFLEYSDGVLNNKQFLKEIKERFKELI